MNVGIPLTLSSLCLAHILVAQTPIAVLDDAILVSQGVHLPTPPIETFGNRFQTLSGFTLHTWDGATGNLIDAKELPSPISPNQDPSTLESPESNLFAYQNTAGHLVLRDYENGEVLRIHNFNTQYQNRTPRLLRLLTGGKLLLVQTQIKSSSSSSFASYSNEHHLIDTENGDIIRSFPTGSASTFSLLSIPNDEAILIIDYDFTFSSGSIPDQTPLLIQGHRLHGIYLINSQTAEDLIPPIKPDPNAVGFRGSITANPDLSLFFACLSPDTIFRINVSDASVTSTPLAGFTDLQFLTFKNQSLFGLVKKENDSFFSNRLATWNSQTLQLRSIIDRLIDGYPTIRTYLPSLKDNQAIITTHSGGIEIWDTLSQSKLQTIREENVNGFGEAVNNLSLSPDGKKLIAHVSTQPQPESIVLDLESREKLYSTADLLPTGIFSPNSRYTLFRDDQDKLIAIDLNNGRKTFETPSKGRKTIAVGFYNNENILAVSDDGYVKKIDSQNAILRPLDFPNPKIYNINSQDGSLLYAAGNQVRLYTPA
ncbi:MAG: WD40 repeat domain-containing protein, partial [Verrucomicrobiota bacterium]